MSKSDRAKQFIPFDALKGLQEALREKEIEHTQKIDLAEEEIEKISEKLQSLEIGDNVKITYYKGKVYKEIEGKVQKIDTVKKSVFINDVKINFIDILKIEN